MVSAMVRWKTLRWLLYGLLLSMLLWWEVPPQLVPGRLPAGSGQLFREQNPVLAASKPQRIVSMAPGITEILFALGAGDRVVGVTSYSDYPEEAKTKPSIGGYYAPDMEKIVALQPDMVFALRETQARYIRILEQAGIPVVAVEPRNMQEILTAIDTISVAIGEQERGAALHAALAHQLATVRRVTAAAAPKRVFLEIWDAPLLTVGRKSFINDIITQAGGINVAADKDIDYTVCDIETLYAYNPDVYIFVSHGRNDPRFFLTRPHLAAIAAVKNGQVFPIDGDLLMRPGPRSFTGLVKLAAILHPEMMQDEETKDGK